MVPSPKVVRMGAVCSTPHSSPTSPPAPFATQHATQSPTAHQTAKLLQRGTQRTNELLVAPRAGAAQFFRMAPLLIALARWDRPRRDVRCARQRRDGTRVRRRRGCMIDLIPGPLPRPFPPTPTLLDPAALALLTGAITLIGTPLRPTPRSDATNIAAITGQRMKRVKQPLAALQQAATQAATETSRLI